MVIIQYYIYFSSCQDICKAKKQQIYTFNACVSDPFPALADESENATQSLWTSNKYQKELGNYYYITQLCPELTALNLHIVATFFLKELGQKQHIGSSFTCSAVQICFY